MKCENCGGEIGSNQKYCTYCGAENKNVYLHQQRVEEKIERNEKIKSNVLENNSSKIVNKVMTFVLIGSIILLIVSFFVAVYKVSEEDVHKEIDYDKVDKFYEDGEYEKMVSYIFSSDYYDEPANKYMQLAEFYEDYFTFIQYRNRYIISVQTGEGNEEYTVESLAGYIVSMFNPYSGWKYDEGLGKNQEVFDECTEDVADFLKAYFDFTDEDIEGLVEGVGGSYYDIESELEERMKTVYYNEKGNKENEEEYN